MTFRLLALAALLGAAAMPAAAKTCGNITINQHDYRQTDANSRYIVEVRHFTEDIELGVHNGALGGDLEYTLQHYPNHPRVLNTVLRVAPRYRFAILPGARLPVECYFERAVRFYPDDGIAWLMYARFQFMRGKDAEALEMLQRAVNLSPDEPSINYNLGLVYAKQKKYEQALPYAQKAYAQNFPLPALKQTLIKAGKWVEPEPLAKPAEEETAAEPAPSPAPAPAANPAPPAKP